MHTCLFVLFPPADQQTLPMKTVDMAAFPKQSFSFGIILKNCCSCNIYRITSLLRVFLRLFEELKSASAAFLTRVHVLHRWLDFY